MRGIFTNILGYYKLCLFILLPLVTLPLALVLEGEKDGIDFQKLGQFRYICVISEDFSNILKNNG